MKPEIPTIRGDKWRSSYQAQVVGILGSSAPPVRSIGDRFLNIGRWVLNALIGALCKWSKAHPGKGLTRTDLNNLVAKANSMEEPRRQIQIARTPDKLPIRTALALIGGANHEAFHSFFSREKNLQVSDVDFLLEIWGKIPDWSLYHSSLMECSNIVEDIRIERRGKEYFPGTVQKLRDLQDFILQQEAAKGVAKGVGRDSLSIALRVFRDVGLGYGTSTQIQAMDRYRKCNAKAVDFVLDGPLTPLLKEAISLSDTDDVGCLRLACEIIWTLIQNSLEGQSEQGQSEQGQSEQGQSGQGQSEQNQSQGQGAKRHKSSETDWAPLLEEGVGIQDSGQILSDALSEGRDRERGEDVQADELPYCPYDMSLDQVLIVKPSKFGKTWDMERARILFNSVRQESSFLRTRLRRIIYGFRQRGTLHGVRQGKGLSERHLADTQVALLSGKKPDRAYWDRGERLDFNLAAAVVIDQSRSMRHSLTEAVRMLCALSEPLAEIGCPVQVSGIRDGKRSMDSMDSMDSIDYQENFHRINGVTHDIFKLFHESHKAVMWRFPNVQARGGTPLADGIQFGLDSLLTRSETHRVLFVITDGVPNAGTIPTIRRQIRLAKMDGIHVIGVGVGVEAVYVKDIFPDHVHSDQVAEMPRKLIVKLNELIDTLYGRRRLR